MKKILSLLLFLALTVSAALADASLITGEVVEIPTPGDVRILLGENAFEASFNDRQMYGAVQPDGTLLIGTREKALRLAGLPDAGLLQGLFSRLEQQPTYENSMFSSLFTSAQQIELTADEVCGYARAVLGLCPLLDPDGALWQAASGSYGGETWATVTRYLADPAQYPNTWVVEINVFSPVLPPVRVQYRQDEYGCNFELAYSRNPVTDWDETILAIEEDLSGENGCVLRGFTMADSGVDSWYYLEVAGYGFGYLWRAAVDLNRDMGDPRIWEATIVINNDTDNTPVAAAKLRSEGSGQQPMPAFDGALIVDATDGLDDAERETLALREFFR